MAAGLKLVQGSRKKDPLLASADREKNNKNAGEEGVPAHGRAGTSAWPDLSLSLYIYNSLSLYIYII